MISRTRPYSQGASNSGFSELRLNVLARYNSPMSVNRRAEADLNEPLLRLTLAVQEIRRIESDLSQRLGSQRVATSSRSALRKISRAAMQIQVAAKELQPFEFSSEPCPQSGCGEREENI